ncbi:MAG: tyrosine-type recombinase/integrase family protein [Clostridia bacterium]|nr:tyrosine-type recombinase/integrase family protein [Clostridia bacterium]
MYRRKRKQIVNEDKDYFKEMLDAMREQTDVCKQILNMSENEKVKRERNLKSGNLNFTQKELKQMPRLKDFKIRIKEGRYYEIRYRKHGYNKSFSSTNFKTAKEKAFSWLRTYEHEIYAGTNFTVVSSTEMKALGKKVEKRTKFKTFADEYMYNVRKRRVKPLTFVTYKNYYEKEILPVYGKMMLKDIAPIMIQKHLDKLHARMPRGCEDIKSLLNGIFEYAVNNGIIDRNPIKAVFLEKHEREIGKALTPEQERKFINDIKGTKNEWVYLKMLYSGVRPGEISGIVEDKEKNTLTIKNGKLKSYQKKLTRTIPIFPKYKETLAHPIREFVYLPDLRADLKKYLPNNQLKDLRHTFTTRARECGIDNELVAVWTGHSLGNITSSVYTHFSDEFQQEQALKLIYN